MINNLSQFGHNFQIKSIVCFMTKLDFMEQVFDILDEKYYDGEAKKWIVKQCKHYFVEYKKLITFDVFKIKTDEIQNDILKATIIETLKDVYNHLEAVDLEFVQNKVLDFFKNQLLKQAIVESVNILEVNGDFEQIKNLIDGAMKAGMERNIGHDYLKMINMRYEEMARTTLATPWDTINELMQGGLAAGELGIIVTPPGVGKSWCLASIGANAVKDGKTVVHYTLELNEAYVGLRYDSIFTNISNQNLKYHKEDVEKRLRTLSGKLMIKYYPTKTASVHTIASHLQKIKTIEGDVDLVIVDYADIVRDHNTAKEIRHQLGNVYEDLRGLAGQFEVPIWSASQSNRASLEEDIIEGGRIAEAFGKLMISDFVMSLSRKMEDKIANTGRFHIIKNRFGPDGLTYPSKVNTNTGKIEIYNTNSVNGREQQKKIDNRDQLTRKILSNKYEELMEGES